MVVGMIEGILPVLVMAGPGLVGAVSVLIRPWEGACPRTPAMVVCKVARTGG